MKAKACAFLDTIRTDQRARRRAAIGSALFIVFLAWLSLWLLAVLAYLIVATAVLLRSELLQPAPREDDDWF